MDYFSNMFKTLFTTTTSRYKNRMAAQVRKDTIGKVQAKAMKKRIEIEQAAFKATDKVTGKDKSGSGQVATNPSTAKGVPQQAGQVSAKQRGTAKMGKGSSNKRGMKIQCLSCGQNLQPDWDMCPFCGTPVGSMGGQQSAAGNAPMVNAGMPENSEKTMAINIDELNLEARRPLVGWIVAQSGNQRGEDFRIYDGKNIIGTAADCDIVITDGFLSAKHCTIRHEGGNFQITDLDSMNGTFVNQKRCTKSDLIDNDTIRLGRTEFKFKSLF